MSNVTLEISKEAIAELPTAHFSGRSIIIDNPRDCAKAMRYLLTQRCVGFDTETRPTFRKGEHHNVALLQVATPDECFLFRLNRLGLTDEIAQLFEAEEIIKVGLSIKDDLHQLGALRAITTQSMVELQTYVKQFGIADNSLQKVYAIIFGERISKGQRLTNWESERLSESQCAYASLDAYACLRIYHHLAEGHFNPTESPYYVTELKSQ